MPNYINNWQLYTAATNQRVITWTQYNSLYTNAGYHPAPTQNSQRTKVEFEDTEVIPADRGDHILCLNCGRPWLEHWNWGCTAEHRELRKSEILSSKRYRTEDMLRAEKKKFSHVSQRKLKKKARELLLAKESLLK